MVFEQGSGQVFTETTVRLPRQKLRRRLSNSDSVKNCPSGSRWLYSCRGSRLTDGTLNPGPPSLQLIAARSLLRNLDLVEDGALCDLQPALIERVWGWIKRS